jgi:hypothetical protein
MKEAIKIAEEILARTLNGNVKIKEYCTLNPELFEEIKSIDYAKFRKELQYSLTDLQNRASNSGFYCIIIYLDDGPIAFDYGYNDSSEKNVFFSDSAATMIERKGIGRILSILELLYLYENGYKFVRFTTEEVDEMGRPLREIWEKQGYRVEKRYPDGGVDMMLEINPSIVAERIKNNLR